MCMYTTGMTTTIQPTRTIMDDTTTFNKVSKVMEANATPQATNTLTGIPVFSTNSSEDKRIIGMYLYAK